MASDDGLIASHEDRIQSMEADLKEMSQEVLPTLSRLEQLVTSGFERFDDRLASMNRRMDGVEANSHQNQIRDSAIKALQEIEERRLKSRHNLKKWALTTVGGAVLTAFLAWLGLWWRGPASCCCCCLGLEGLAGY